MKDRQALTYLKERAQLFHQLRQFFYERDVTEVDTPALMPHTVTDPYMSAISVELNGHSAFLQTSPEFAMKRLIAQGSGDIYQLSHMFRAEEQGCKHLCEFTLLEWYRLGWDHHQLMQEVFDLLKLVLKIEQKEVLTYHECFQQFCHLNISSLDDKTLKAFTEKHCGLLSDRLIRDDYLSLLFATQIEPNLGKDRITFVTEYPASQAALAKKLPEDNNLAARFEVFYQGVELANGFWELTDAKEQRERFMADNQQRETMGKPKIILDEDFLQALVSGLPDCAGVALGVDRLLMLLCKESDIRNLVPFQ